MKLWIKTYIITLVLSLVLINSGIYMVFNMTYKKDLNVEQSRGSSTFIILEQSFERNINNMEKNGDITDEDLRELLGLYEKYYKSLNVSLKLWNEEGQIYPQKNEKPDKSLFKEKKSIISIKKQQGYNNLIITKIIESKGKKYYFIYNQKLEELAKTWNVLEKNYVYMSMAVSVILAIVLLFVLRRLNRPVRDLGIAVEKMKEGSYTEVSEIRIKGRDDIAKLQESFNEMAGIINENIRQIKEEVNKRQEFVDNFSHELKSPLTTIYGFAEYVSKAKISEAEKKECMDFIMEESNRMLHLSYTLLDMAKIRNNPLVMEKIEVNTLVDSISKMVRKYMEDNSIKFVKQISGDYITGNMQLIQSLIHNLIRNSVNAIIEKGNSGKIILEIRKEGKNNIIKITDNGCGMKKEETKHIMEPFYRIDKARSRENGGTGLGLSLCSQIVTAHKGRIICESKEGQGTEITVEIPTDENI